MRHEISTRGCNLRQEIENSQTNFGDFLEFDGALAESQQKVAISCRQLTATVLDAAL